MASRPPDRREFREICRREFQYLVTDYGFKELPQSEDPWDFSVRFENTTTALTVVGRSFGYGTEVYVDHAGAPPPMTVPELESFDIQPLLARRKVRLPIVDTAGPGWLVWFISLFLPWGWFRLQSDQRLQIAAYAKAIREGAQDVLQGDLTALGPKPQPIADSSGSGLRTIGWGVVLLGVILAAWKFGLVTFVKLLVTAPNLEVLGVAQPIVAGFLLVAIDAYQTRRRTRARSGSTPAGSSERRF